MVIQGVIQAKVEVGHQVWDSYVWDSKLQTQISIYLSIYLSIYIYMIKISKRAETKQKKTKEEERKQS